MEMQEIWFRRCMVSESSNGYPFVIIVCPDIGVLEVDIVNVKTKEKIHCLARRKCASENGTVKELGAFKVISQLGNASSRRGEPLLSALPSGQDHKWICGLTWENRHGKSASSDEQDGD